MSESRVRLKTKPSAPVYMPRADGLYLPPDFKAKVGDVVAFSGVGSVKDVKILKRRDGSEYRQVVLDVLDCELARDVEPN